MRDADTVELALRVNGTAKRVSVDPRLLLVEAIRESLGLKGTRIGCLTGDCGACTIWLDGKLTKSCLVLAVAAQGREVLTIEGASSPQVERLRQAFIDHHGFQCGYCTSGMVLAGAELLARNPKPDETAIRQAISGNLCRCTGYDSIVAAITAAANSAASADSSQP